MSYTITTPDLSYNDIVALIAAHIVTADREIDDKELKTVNRYRANDSDSSAYLKQVYEDAEDKISFSDLLAVMNNFSQDEIIEAYEFFMEVAYADGYFHPEENQIISTIREQVSIDERIFKGISKKAKETVSLYTEKDDKLIDSLREKTYGLLSKFSSNDKNIFRKKQKDLIFKGSKFVSQIKEISEYAQSDLDFVEPIVKQATDRVDQLLKRLDEQDGKLKKIKKQDDGLNKFTLELKKTVKASALSLLKETKDVLEKKKRTIDYFTISFLGRTKAGKSTLHSIMVNDGDDDIGVGKLRTTRYNRVYNWENLRIVDTPGIGAPGGEEDEKIAKSIIDESDLICYMVANDSTQETEHKFLAEIKKKNKPVIIILNAKGSLSGKRLDRFWKKPKDWKEKKNKKGDLLIQGHLDRIDDYMGQHYGNSYYKVIPVMLLAAKVAEQESDEKRKQILHESSDIDVFFKELKNIVFEHGHLRKSQNIIGGCSFQLDSIYKVVSQQEKEIQNIVDRLSSSRKAFNKFLRLRTPHYKTVIEGVIDKYSNEAEKSARDFSLENYSLNKTELKVAWKQRISDLCYFENLEKSLQLKFNDFGQEIQERLEEEVNNIQIHFNRVSITIQTNSIFNTSIAIKITGGVFAVLAAIAAVPALPLAVSLVGVFTGAGLAFSFGSSMLKSKAKKIEEAKRKIENSLVSGIERQQKEYKEKCLPELSSFVASYRNICDNNFSSLIQSGESIKKELTQIRQELERELSLLQRGMGIRMFQSIDLIENEPNLTKLMNKDQTIQAVSQDFTAKSKIEIKTYHQLKDEQIQKISELMQSKIIIKNI